MASTLQICRICLSANVRMFILENTNMENLYKLLTQVYINVEDGKPTTVCFLCYARLRQCDRLQQQALKSNELLEQLLRSGFMQETANAILSNQYTSQDLQVSSTYYLDLEPVNCKDVFLDPKVEVNSRILIKKEEAIDVGHNVTEFFEYANDPNDFTSEAIQPELEDDQPLITECFNKCDGIQDNAGKINWKKREEEENLCMMQPEKEVKNDLNLCNSTQTQEKDKTSNNSEESKGINIKPERNMKNAFSTKSQKCQKPINNDVDAEVDLILERKLEKTKTNAILNKQKINEDIQKNNINVVKTFAIDSITDEFHCNECGNLFSTKDILTDHILKCMKTPQTPVSDSQLMKANSLMSLLSEMYTCNICSYKTYNKRFLESHLKMHNVTKYFTCFICEYRCALKGDLKRHMNKHTGEKPFSCNICKYRCALKGDLKRHMKKHTGEKPFSCNICEYKGTDRCKLNQHMKKHTGEKPFSCNVCEYACTRKDHLIAHIRRHTGEKPFSCNSCEYKCAHELLLKVHMSKHTGEKPFSCNICEYRCARKDGLNRHMKQHTSDKIASRIAVQQK